MQLPSADAVHNVFELLKQLALSLSPSATATATAAPTAAAATGAAGAAASASQAASDASAPSAPVAVTPRQQGVQQGAHAAELAAFRAGVGGAAPPPGTAEQRPRAVPLETPRGTALVAEDGTPLTAMHHGDERQAGAHKKERKRAGKRVKKAA